MKSVKIIFIALLALFASVSSLFAAAADDELYAAMFVDNLLFEAYNEHGMTDNIKTLAEMADMKVLERVASGASKMKAGAEFALKVVKAYQDGKSATEIAAMIAKELGVHAYNKIKGTAKSYIKSKISVLGQLESAYDTFGALYNTSNYIAYVGMSIGLDMMSEESIAKLEQSGFHKAAVWITENTNKILSMAEQGKEEAIEKFLSATEGNAFERFSNAVVGAVEKTLENAHEGAMDLGQKIIDTGGSFWDFITSPWRDSDNNTTPDGDNTVNNDDNNSSAESGDSVVSNGDNNSSSESGDNTVSEDNNNNQAGSTPSGDDVNPVSGNSGNNGNSTPSGDDVSNGSSDSDYSFDNYSDGDNFSDDETLPLGKVLETIKDKSPIVGPNIPHYRILWLFSGENWGDVAVSVVENAIDLFKGGNFSDIGKKISEEMGFEDMKAALESIGD